jgi:xanthosine utilization system XapX-like protein
MDPSGLGAIAAWSGAALSILIVIGLIVGLLPIIVAVRRRHPNVIAITVLTLVLGWTLVGWALALIWACTDYKYEALIPTKRESRDS